MTKCELSKPLNFQSFSIKKLNKLLTNYLEILSSSDNPSEIEVENVLTARTSGTVEAKINTIFSISSRFSGEIYTPVYPANISMSVIPRDCKAAEKPDCLPKLFSRKLVEVNYEAGSQLEAIRDMIVRKNRNLPKKN